MKVNCALRAYAPCHEPADHGSHRPCSHRRWGYHRDRWRVRYADLTGPNAFNAKGFGQIKPSTIFLGGDPTGLVCRIHWLTWGGALAVGTGVGWTINSHESVAEGAPARAVFVLSRLGPWDGRPAYKSWAWYFPEGRNGFHPPACEIGGHPA